MSKPFRIIFCGTPAFAVPSLEALAKEPAFEIALVVTQPDRPVGRKQIMTPPPVKIAAERLRLPVWQPENINTEATGLASRAGGVDFLIVVAYGKILGQTILDLPTVAPVNVHASLLPRWRGASPVEHAILAGDADTGVTIQIMAPALDAGDILAQAHLAIGPRATTPALKEELSRLGATLLVETLRHPLRPVPQSESGITVCRKLSRENGAVDPLQHTAEDIDRRVRALNPWPGVTCPVQGRPVKLLETSLVTSTGSVPLPCAQGTTLYLTTVQEAGKRPMRADAWKRGLAVLVLFLASAIGPMRSAAQVPELKDTDGDALLDTIEDKNGNGIMDAGETDPMNADTDRGGEADGSEIHGGRDPFVKEDDFTYDRDSDGLTNGRELILGTDSKNPDTDGDGVQDGPDPFPLERAYKLDANRNGLPDEWEQEHRLSAGTNASGSSAASSSPSSSASANPSVLGASVIPPASAPLPAAAIATGDPDGDGLSNTEEFVRGTDPRKTDTDRDGVTDGQEVQDDSEPTESACLAYDPDIPALPDIESHWSKDVVTQLQRVLILPTREPVIRGYQLMTADGTPQSSFLPDRFVTRFEFLKMALFSSCVRLVGASEAVTPFPDVPAHRPHESADRALIRRVIATAVSEDIVQGYPDGLFRPDEPVTRAEALKMLLRSTRLQPLPDELEETPPFPDVPADAWFRGFVEHGYAMRLIEGYSDGNFRPHASITRAESAKIIDYALLTNPGVNGYVIP